MRFNARRRVLAGVLIAQIVTVTALVLTSGQISAEAEQSHTDSMLQASAEQTATRTRAHIAPAEALVALTATLVAEPGIAAAQLERTLLQALASSAQLAGVFIATPAGDFTYASREGAGYRIKTITMNPSGRDTQLTFFDGERSTVRTEADPTDAYDPTSRPWFIQATGDPDTTIWTDPYVFFTSRQLGVTTARAIVSEGEVVAVVGVDIELASLSQFLATLPIPAPGATMLINSNGTVLAHPDASLLQVAEGEGYRTVAVAEFGDDYARSAAAALVEQGSGSDQRLHEFDDDVRGESTVAFRSIPVGDGEWTATVFAPRGALVSELKNARSSERVLRIVVGSLTVLLLVVVAFPATRRLRDLETHATTDALTGLPNRRSIMHSAQIVADATSKRALAMIDIDRFKLVNDTYGHHVGDEVLQAVASRIRVALREDAEVGRIGGEEFLVTLPGLSRSQATVAVDRIRGAVSASPIETNIGPVEVTISIGVACTAAPAARDSLLSVADIALLEAKEGGRDRIVFGSIDSVESDHVRRQTDEMIT